MKILTDYPILSSIVVGVIASILLRVIPDQGILNWLFMIIITFTGLIFGPRLPIFVRIIFTVLIAYFAIDACLLGRTMEVGITVDNISMALKCFLILALWPSLALLRIWRGRLRILTATLVLPIGLLMACVIAGAEEQIFTSLHRDEGVRPTPRWTFSDHWMAYDSQAKSLIGSD